MGNKKHYNFNKPIDESMFKRRDDLQRLADEHHRDIMDWIMTLHWHGKLVGIDPSKITSVELIGKFHVVIVHEVRNWMMFSSDDETSLITTRIPFDDFFHPEIIKGEPRQLDMDDITDD